MGRLAALFMNINASKGLLDVMKTNLGPKGTIKMLVGGGGGAPPPPNHLHIEARSLAHPACTCQSAVLSRSVEVVELAGASALPHSMNCMTHLRMHGTSACRALYKWSCSRRSQVSRCQQLALGAAFFDVIPGVYATYVSARLWR